jgi:hypothetical protein
MKRKLTEQDREQCIWLLRNARPITYEIRGGYTGYTISRALNDVSMLYPHIDTVTNRLYLQSWIDSQLAEYNYSYTYWVYKKRFKVWNRTANASYAAYMGRIAWIDWMIKELEAGR